MAEPLSSEEKRAWIEHLVEIAKERKLSFEEWKAIFESIVDDTPIIGEFSDRRVDWYDDDGR